jgi:hypothetical protein
VKRHNYQEGRRDREKPGNKLHQSHRHNKTIEKENLPSSQNSMEEQMVERNDRDRDLNSTKIMGSTMNSSRRTSGNERPPRYLPRQRDPSPEEILSSDEEREWSDPERSSRIKQKMKSKQSEGVNISKTSSTSRARSHAIQLDDSDSIASSVDDLEKGKRIENLYASKISSTIDLTRPTQSEKETKSKSSQRKKPKRRRYIPGLTPSTTKNQKSDSTHHKSSHKTPSVRKETVTKHRFTLSSSSEDDDDESWAKKYPKKGTKKGSEKKTPKTPWSTDCEIDSPPPTSEVSKKNNRGGCDDPSQTLAQHQQRSSWSSVKKGSLLARMMERRNARNGNGCSSDGGRRTSSGGNAGSGDVFEFESEDENETKTPPLSLKKRQLSSKLLSSTKMKKTSSSYLISSK